MSIVLAPGGAPPATLQRWLLPLLVVSLSVNLLIAGAALGGGWMLRHSAGRTEPGFGRDIAAGPITRLIGRLSQQRQAELHSLITQQREAGAGPKQLLAAARRDAATVLLAEPIDPARLEAAMKHIAETELTARNATVSTTVALVAKLSLPERRLFLEQLRWPSALPEAGAAPESKAP